MWWPRRSTRQRYKRKRCQALINAIKKKANIDPGTGNPLSPKVLSQRKFTTFFQEIGFEKDDAPKGYERKTDLVMKIVAVVGTDKHGKRQTTAINCESALRSPKALFGDK